MRFTLLLCSVLAAHSAHADDLPQDIWYVSGHSDFSLSDRTSGSDIFTVADAPKRADPIGLSAGNGFFGRADALKAPNKTYGALGLYLGEAGHFAIGVPRPAYDAFAVSKLEAAFPTLSIAPAQHTRSAATQGAITADWAPKGVAFRGQLGALTYGVSAHYAAAPDTSVLGAGAGLTVKDWTVSAALETSGETLSAKAQVERSFKRMQAGLGYYANGADGLPDLIETYGTVQISARFAVTGVVQTPLDQGAVSGAVSGGVKAKFGLTDTSALNIGLGTDSSQTPFFATDVKFRF